jgi:hypothetical protein
MRIKIKLGILIGVISASLAFLTSNKVLEVPEVSHLLPKKRVESVSSTGNQNY